MPAYNEERAIARMVPGCKKYVDKVVDEGSTDRTPEIVKTLTDPRVVSVRHEKNRGVGAALITGYKLALEVMNLDSIYPYYGYCNDMLVKLNAFGMRAVDVVIPSRYGRETSSIRYSRYIVTVAPMIFRGFLWRLRTKYIVLDFHLLFDMQADESRKETVRLP